MRPATPNELTDAVLADRAAEALNAAAARPGLIARILADLSLDAKVALHGATFGHWTRPTPRTARMRASGQAPGGDAA